MGTDVAASRNIENNDERKRLMNVVKWKHLQDLASRIYSVNLNPHDSSIAWLLRQLHLERIAFSFVLALTIGFLIVAKIENADLRALLEKPYAFMVPSHIPDVIKIRANTIPDESVFTFSQEFVTQLGNTNWEDVEERYKDLQKYMHPTLKARFARDMRESIKLWQNRHIDQKFTFQRPSKYDRKTEKVEGVDTVVFTVETWGTVKKYVEGRATDPYREKITLKFTTNNISQDRWWVFELIDIRRESVQEIEDAKLINTPQGEKK